MYKNRGVSQFAIFQVLLEGGGGCCFLCPYVHYAVRQAIIYPFIYYLFYYLLNISNYYYAMSLSFYIIKKLHRRRRVHKSWEGRVVRGQVVGRGGEMGGRGTGWSAHGAPLNYYLSYYISFYLLYILLFSTCFIIFYLFYYLLLIISISMHYLHIFKKRFCGPCVDNRGVWRVAIL